MTDKQNEPHGDRQAKHGLGSAEAALPPESAKLAASLIREYVGEHATGITVDGDEIADDAVGSLLTELDAVASQA